MVQRTLTQLIRKKLSDKKALILLGPRQSGKSTLLRQIEPLLAKPVLWWNGDESDVRANLEKVTSTRLKSLIGKNRTLIIDEAQRIANIGLCIKLITDNIPGVKVVATGSSAFELSNHVNEPLTGRKWEFHLYPFSYAEMVHKNGKTEERRLLEHRLVYGYYPDVVNNPGQETELLKQLSSSYLYKDILTWERLHKPERMEKLVQALALQLGNQVSYHELGQITGLDNETVEKYITLLEKAFVVFRLRGLNRNLRTELKKTRKIYFYDNGLRNAVINSFSPLSLRNDKGALWENFLVSERMKHLAYSGTHVSRYFWRTNLQQEIDYIEEQGAHIHAYEFKWKSTKRIRFPATFSKGYPNAKTLGITTENFERFVGVK